MLAEQKLTTYNFVPTPYGADSVRLAGTLELRQKDLYSPGSIKRLINFDNLSSELAQMSLQDYLKVIESYNTTC